MKISEDTRFPHPVLSEDTGDYVSGEFGVSVEIDESPGKAEVTVDYKVILTEPSIRALVADDRAGVGIMVTCVDTYFSQLVPFGLADGRFSFDPGALSGRVAVRPLVWVRKPVSAFSLANCDPEFGSGTIDFTPGDVLALGQEEIISVGREKLAQMETIFTLAKSDSLSPNTLAVDLDADRIRVLVASDAYEHVNTLRGFAHGRPIILNSVFLPAVMEVLNVLRDGTSTYEGRRWFRVFSAKCDHFGINVEKAELWRDAQKLLSSPYGEIRANGELSGS